MRRPQKCGSHAPVRKSSASMSSQFCHLISCQHQDPNHVHHPLNQQPIAIRPMSQLEFQERIALTNAKQPLSERARATVLLAPCKGLPWLFRARSTPKHLLIHLPDPSLQFPISRVCLLGDSASFQEGSFQLVPVILGSCAPIRTWHLVPTSTQSSIHPLLTLELLSLPTPRQPGSSEQTLTQTMPTLTMVPELKSGLESSPRDLESGILPPILIVVEPSSA